jgi:hypothetical protein
MNARLAVLLAAAAGAIACRAKLATETPAYQEQKYVFPHSTHVDADVACTNCHAMTQAKKLEANVRHAALPKNPSKQAACKDCHDTDPKITIPKRTTPFRLTFDHAAHLPRVSGDCKRCHVQQPEAGATSYQWPAMAACTSCHNHQQDFVQAKCMPCHTDLKGYQKPVSAFAHVGDWLRTHAALAREQGESCAACHDQTFCAECHSPTTTPNRPSITYPERVDRTFIHRGDYVSRHMIDQAANPSSCRKCHGSGFCEACHQQEGFSKFVPDFRKPPSHQATNWALAATPGALPGHAQAGRRDITNCSACHDQGAQATCVGCHQVGGIADRSPNGPHPQSFITKHRGEDKSKNSVCVACHR